ncbi:MAG: 1-deoxy-D-xylulose-5-phosphate reductoisomerase [Nitrospinaceae bacterium]|jgi:1-deoxy-D-xylulose-5-phosphate reductoisomerase|nr:MAG: 1-deoxy-D-xylulose-5-phosphate reductoisomerase [Nitrospinaceae bacterium]
MKRIALLGSTGSIGVSTLDVVARNPDKFQVCSMAAGSNVELFAEQVKRFHPETVSIFDTRKEARLRSLLADQDVRVVSGEDGTVEAATCPGTNIVVSGIVGSAGLVPTLAAIRAGIDVALANKETLVVAGELVLREAANRAALIPIDSEHSAIFQALNGEPRGRIKKIILTASGGPFRTFSKERMETVTVKEALNHPNWEMGHKITIDSATMMNKGLEYIEAKWLFGPGIDVEVLIHPQSIIHSMIEFVDTSIMAQLGIPDMRVPIAYALSYPDRLEADLPSLNLGSVGQLTFEEPDLERFPCLRLAFEAMEMGQTMPAVLNAANEVAVRAFLQEEIAFKDIADIIQTVMQNHSGRMVNELEDVLAADRWAREEARKKIAVAH